MSSALAIAGVSAVLRDLLNDGLINQAATDNLGVVIKVSVGPPDRVIPENGSSEKTQLNLFMYQVTPNTGWRNEALPSRNASGKQRLTNPPLALNLHYLISAHTSEDLHAEMLLGLAMQTLHETPVLGREAIIKGLSPPHPSGQTVTPTMKALEKTGLQDQIEQIKITPEYLGTEEISRLWTATQSHLRPAAAYMASVVLIQAEEPARSPLPVLSRGPVIKPDPAKPSTWYEKGITALPDLIPPVPMLVDLMPGEKQPVAQMGVSIELQGHHLDAKSGTTRTVRLINDRFKVDQPVPASDPPVPPKASATSLMFIIADTNANAKAFAVGVYSVSAELTRPGEDQACETNQLAMTLAPKITDILPASVATGAILQIKFSPALHAGQKAVLIVGQQEFKHEDVPPADFPVTSLDFKLTDAPVTPAPGLLVRLRVDGIESPIIDRSVEPPVFLDQRVVIT